MSNDTLQFFQCPLCGKHHDKAEKVCPVKREPIPEHYKYIGSTLEGKYSIRKIIGEGGMGVVFEANHILIGRRLAVKVLFPEVATNNEIVERFYNEARTAAAIGHEHIIEITDMGMYNGSPFIVMEYLEGQSLTKLMEGKVLPVDVAVGITLQILDALNAVHNKGVIHRDLKPDNIFLIEKGGRKDFVKLLDFGISKLKTLDSKSMALTRTGTIMGTPYYMAPEQAAGKKEQDHRIDIYAVGVILYEMLTGRLPYSGDNYNALIAAILTEEPVRPRNINPDIPQEVENIIMTAIAKHPAQRFSNALQFMEALKPFAPSWLSRPSKVSVFASTALISSQPGDETRKNQSSYVTQSAEITEASKGSSTISRTFPEEFPEKPKSRLNLIIASAIGVVLIVAGAIVFFMVNSGNGKKDDTNDLKIQNKVQNLNLMSRIAEKQDNKEPEKTGVENFEPAQEGEVKLEFTGIPDGGIITLDGVRIEKNPVMVKPSLSPREVVIEAPGYETWVARKVINSNTHIEISMKKMEEEGKKKKGRNQQTVEGTPTAANVTGLKSLEDSGKKEKGGSGEEDQKGIYKGKVKIKDIEYPE